MDPRLLSYYNRELAHLREVGGEFAAEFPKVAARLGLSAFECADPYVERLLEGFAFLAARVQLKIDAEFPTFTQHMLELVYPHYLAPTPSMAVVALQPDLSEGALAAGFPVPRGTALRGNLGKGEQTACEYRTAHPVRLWPLELTQAEYFRHSGPVAKTDLTVLARSEAGIRLRLRASAGLRLDQIALDELVLFLQGSDQLPFHLYEALLANPVALLVQPTTRPLPWIEVLPGSALRPLGFDDDEALLPYAPNSFQGYRNLHEYFAFPQRFLFLSLAGLAPALQRVNSPEVDLIVLLPRPAPAIDGVLRQQHFALHCTPAINLFPRRFDRIHLNDGGPDYHVVPDRTRPLDFEVYRLDSVTGIGTATTETREFHPFYKAIGQYAQGDRAGLPSYFSVQRVPRRLSSNQRRHGHRSSYLGSEVFVNLVDAADAPWSRALRQLSLTGLCTNRDLPLALPVGIGASDFSVDCGAPIAAARVCAGPTPPLPSHAHGDTAWRLLSHLSLNYLSIADSEGAGAAALQAARGGNGEALAGAHGGAGALRELLALYADLTSPELRRQLEGIRAVRSESITRRLPGVRPVTYARGLAITLDCDEAAFEGTGSFLLGAVLDRFFARYCSINSFTETRLRTARGEIMRWPAQLGRRPLL